jgi:hypothetical protein
MGQPSGEVIARPMVARACGCMREFQHYAVDKYRAQRLAKFQKTRCEECVAKLNEQQRLAAANIPKKGEAFKQLPNGTQMTIQCRDDGTWTGTLTAEGKTVQADGEGPQGVALALARVWLIATGHATATPPPAAPAPTAGTAPKSAHPAPKPPPPGPRPALAARPAPAPAPKPKPG